MKINELGLNHVGHDTLLSEPQYTLIVDTPGELDWYKLGQHFATLGQQDPREYGQPESDMMLVAPNEEQLIRYMKELDRLGATYKLVGGSHEHPEIHSEAWSAKYKRSIDCNNPKGFSQRAHCQGRKLTDDVMGESNPFTDARMNAIKANKKEFIVRGKKYRVTGDTRDEEEAIANEAEQQELPIDVNNIIKLIQKLESMRYIAPEDADKMRRAVESLTSARQTINPAALLQLLTIASK